MTESDSEFGKDAPIIGTDGGGIDLVAHAPGAVVDDVGATPGVAVDDNGSVVLAAASSQVRAPMQLIEAHRMLSSYTRMAAPLAATMGSFYLRTEASVGLSKARWARTSWVQSQAR
jgi:hypothetical protein